MKKDLKLEKNEELIKNRLFILILLIAYPAYILHSFVISPIYTMVYSNIVYNGTWVPLALDLLLVIIDIAVIFFLAAMVIYGLCRLPEQAMRSSIIIAILAPLFKNALKMIISPFIDGIPSLGQLFLDIYSLAVSCVLEMLQIAAIVFISYKFIKIYKERKLIIDKAAERLGKENVPSTSLLPFEKAYSKQNPLQVSALISGITVSAIRVVMLLIHDLNTGFVLTNISAVLMFFGSYILEIIVGLLGYLFMLYLFISIDSRLNNN